MRIEPVRSALVSIVPVKSVSDRSTSFSIVPVRSLLERSIPVSVASVKSAPVSMVPERSFPLKLIFERSVPAKLMLDKSVRSSKFELFKFANTNLAPSISVFLKLVSIRSALSKTAFCRFKLSKFFPDKSAPTAYTTLVPSSLSPICKSF